MRYAESGFEHRTVAAAQSVTSKSTLQLRGTFCSYFTDGEKKKKSHRTLKVSRTASFHVSPSMR